MACEAAETGVGGHCVMYTSLLDLRVLTPESKGLRG